MDEFDLSVALLTPASDISLGDPGAKFEANFARAGNDVVYAYDPGSQDPNQQNVDFLFGDIFDNSTEEFETVLNIQNTAQDGNPLLILDRNIPSVGKDRFVLGDEFQPYYTTGNSENLSTTNLLGLNEFAVLYDFDPAQDTIQLNGKRKDYQLVDVNGLQVEGISQPFSGKAIFSLQQGLPDLVGYVIAKPDVKLDLKNKSFQFVGDKADKKPAQKKIGQLGTTGIDLAFDAATDPSGNVYITGSTSGPLGKAQKDVTDSGTDVWAAKYDVSGNQQFLKQFGTRNNSETAYAVATDKDANFYLAGSSGPNATVAKYTSDGNLVWSQQVKGTGGLSATSFGLQVDDAGNVYLSGLAIKENQDLQTFNFSVEDDAWVAKFNSGGTQQWLTQIDTPFFNENYDLAIDKDGNSYAVGWTQGLVNESDPSRQLLKYDAWIAKQNTNGQTEWIQQLGSTNQGLEFAWGVDTDSQGNIYVTGWTTGDIGTKDKKFKNSDSYDIWLAKFNPNGEKQWAKQIGSKGDDGMYASDLEIDAQDNIFLTGYTNDKLGKGQQDKKATNAWVARFDINGNNKWVQQFGSKDNLDYGTGLAADGNGKLYVTGLTEAFLGNNGDISGANGSATDAWLAQLDVEKGKLQKFIGNPKDVVSDPNPSTISTTDISNVLVTDEQLPSGDDIINPAEGISTTKSTLDYGQIESSLGGIFDPSGENSFPAALAEAVNNGTITI